MLTTLGNGTGLLDQVEAGFPDSTRGFLPQGQTLLHLTGKVGQTVQTLRESLARQSWAEPERPRQRLTRVPGNTQAFRYPQLHPA